jgi:hypothetical protein
MRITQINGESARASERCKGQHHQQRHGRARDGPADTPVRRMASGLRVGVLGFD